MRRKRIHCKPKEDQSVYPGGIDNGQTFVSGDKGEPGVNGGPRGDLLGEVNVSAHPSLKRQDIHIFSTHPISFAVAALGGDIRRVGNLGIGCISDYEPQPLLIQSHHGSFAIVTVGKINNEEELLEKCLKKGIPIFRR